MQRRGRLYCLYLNSMSSLRVLQDTHAQHQTQRLTLKERLMWAELSQLDACLNKAKALSKTIKAIHSSFRQPARLVPSEGQINGRMIPSTAKILHEMHDLINSSNISFRNSYSNQQSDKKAQQGFFMHTLRSYEGRIGELNRKIKSIESTIQSYSISIDESEGEEPFDELLSSYGFLEGYLKVQTQKQMIFGACMESAGSVTSIQSQSQSKGGQSRQPSKKLASSILLKEKLVNERVKKKILLLRKQQAEEKLTFQRLAKANKDTNSRIANLHLQASINSNCNFLLEGQHYVRHWKAMKEAIDTRLSSFPPIPTHNCQLIRSHSCTVMETSYNLQEQDKSLVMDGSISIENEESLLEDLEYFISEEFIKDLTDHQID